MLRFGFTQKSGCVVVRLNWVWKCRPVIGINCTISGSLTFRCAYAMRFLCWKHVICTWHTPPKDVPCWHGVISRSHFCVDPPSRPSQTRSRPEEHAAGQNGCVHGDVQDSLKHADSSVELFVSAIFRYTRYSRGIQRLLIRVTLFEKSGFPTTISRNFHFLQTYKLFSIYQRI